MPNYTFVTAWDRDDPAHRADAIAFWNTFGMVDGDELEERAKTLCSLVYCDGSPVGVAVAQDGSLLVTDDASRSIWRVSFTGAGK